MAKSEITDEKYVEAVKITQKLTKQAKQFFEEIIDFAKLVSDTYSTRDRARKIFDKATDELGIENISYDDQILTDDIEVSILEAPSGRRKMTRVVVSNWYHEFESETYYVPLKYLSDISETRKILQKYRKIIQEDKKNFDVSVPDVLKEVTKEFVRSGRTYRKDEKAITFVTEDFKKAAKRIYDDWNEFNIDIKAVQVSMANGRMVLSVIYTYVTSALCVYVTDI